MENSKLKYSRSHSIDFVPKNSHIVEEYELQYDEHHEVIKVKVGEVDLIKEVNSHADEVGIVNIVKNAIAHGEDPMTKFVKNGSGSSFVIDPNATMDEIKESMSENNSKIDSIASTLGVTSSELLNALNNGSINDLILASENKTKDGEQDGEK